MVINVEHVLISAGGTGGHVYPGLAVADYLRQQNVKVTWVGTKQGLESTLVPAANIPLEIISISALRGKGLLNFIFVPVKLFFAILQAIRIFWRIKPDVILGMGGFVSGPCGLTAFLFGKPLYLHEQNAIPGFTNRVLSCFATTVMQAFPGSFKNKRNAIVTGNPVRKNITEIVKPEIRMSGRKDNIRVLITGGSLGAQGLNENVPLALEQISKDISIDVWHQAGKGKLSLTIDNYKQAHVEAKITEYIKSMVDAYEWADLVICRAGALTISELAIAGVASILIPYPYAVDDHQTANAEYLTKLDAAILIQEEYLVPKLEDSLAEIIKAGRIKLIEMAKAARLLAKPDATKIVAEICTGSAHGR